MKQYVVENFKASFPNKITKTSKVKTSKDTSKTIQNDNTKTKRHIENEYITNKDVPQLMSDDMESLNKILGRIRKMSNRLNSLNSSLLNEIYEHETNKNETLKNLQQNLSSFQLFKDHKAKKANSTNQSNEFISVLEKFKNAYNKHNLKINLYDNETRERYNELYRKFKNFARTKFPTSTKTYQKGKQNIKIFNQTKTHKPQKGHILKIRQTQTDKNMIKEIFKDLSSYQNSELLSMLYKDFNKSKAKKKPKIPKTYLEKENPNLNIYQSQAESLLRILSDMGHITTKSPTPKPKCKEKIDILVDKIKKTKYPKKVATRNISETFDNTKELLRELKRVSGDIFKHYSIEQIEKMLKGTNLVLKEPKTNKKRRKKKPLRRQFLVGVGDNILSTDTEKYENKNMEPAEQDHVNNMLDYMGLVATKETANNTETKSQNDEWDLLKGLGDFFTDTESTDQEKNENQKPVGEENEDSIKVISPEKEKTDDIITLFEGVGDYEIKPEEKKLPDKEDFHKVPKDDNPPKKTKTDGVMDLFKGIGDYGIKSNEGTDDVIDSFQDSILPKQGDDIMNLFNDGVTPKDKKTTVEQIPGKITINDTEGSSNEIFDLLEGIGDYGTPDTKHKEEQELFKVVRETSTAKDSNHIFKSENALSSILSYLKGGEAEEYMDAEGTEESAEDQNNKEDDNPDDYLTNEIGDFGDLSLLNPEKTTKKIQLKPTKNPEDDDIEDGDSNNEISDPGGPDKISLVETDNQKLNKANIPDEDSEYYSEGETSETDYPDVETNKGPPKQTPKLKTPENKDYDLENEDGSENDSEDEENTVEDVTISEDIQRLTSMTGIGDYEILEDDDQANYYQYIETTTDASDNDSTEPTDNDIIFPEGENFTIEFMKRLNEFVEHVEDVHSYLFKKEDNYNNSISNIQDAFNTLIDIISKLNVTGLDEAVWNEIKHELVTIIASIINCNDTDDTCSHTLIDKLEQLFDIIASLFEQLFKPGHPEDEMPSDDIENVNYRYTVFLLMSGGSGHRYCAGTLISNLWVLTAARCVWKKDAFPINVVIGSNNIHANGQTITSSGQPILHPLFNNMDGTKLPNDIALLKLDRAVSFFFIFSVHKRVIIRSNPIMSI